MSFTRPLSRRARWAVPAVTVVAVAAAVAVPLVSADASPTLPGRTAGQLLADVASAQARPFSGTVVETARLGLPELPTGDTSTSALSLLTGSHTVRVWYGGEQRTRLALVGTLAESDLIRNGTDLWVWSSKDKTAQHVKLPARSAEASATAQQPALGSVTPAQAAAQALAAIDPTTAVTVDGTARVAGRSAYELVLRPKDTRSLIGSVRLAIDAKTHVPLRVQVFAKNGTTPAFETGFTTVTFSAPPASVFRFTAPPGTKVTQQDLASMDSMDSMDSKTPQTSGKALPHKASAPTIIGKGWTTIAQLDGIQLGSLTSSSSGRANDTVNTLMHALKPVSGSFGSGHVFTSKLVSVLLLDDGRAFIGAVPPSMLEQAASAAGK